MSRPPTIPHGTPSGYNYHRCPCNICRQGNTDRNRRQRAQRYAAGLAPDDPRHGTTNGYRNWGCRCQACTERWAAYQRNYRAPAPRS